jgi:L-alanine-DL-glutamate epimerase-like enolase superfamily enzyme
MSIRLLAADGFILNMRTRMPFRYGITTLTALPHLFLRVEAEIDGRKQIGLSADHLPPKWFTKDPNSAAKDDIAGILEVIDSACTIAKAVPRKSNVFQFWQHLYEGQGAWGGGWGKAPLLAHFGTSLVERAMIDAFCKARNVPFWKAVRHNTLGIDLGLLQPELRGREPKDFLPAEPLRQIIARHTVGMVDPLRDGDIAPADRVTDGLPQSLEACIRAYGLTHFKIKLWGDVAKDVERVRGVAEVIEANVAGGSYAYTFDANENFKDVESFREFWQRLASEPTLARFLTKLLFIEQPMHRAVAMSDAVASAFAKWPDRPPMIIDESDGEVSTAREALAIGYIGTSHKNCKGVFKGLANRCLIEYRNRIDPDGSQAPSSRRYTMSGEDLSNVGPISLQEDLAVVSAIGIGDVERNGHHYFSGLSALPADIQQTVANAHPDMYRPSAKGYPALHIEAGRLNIGSVVDAPFGTAFHLDVDRFTPIAQWRYETL